MLKQVLKFGHSMSRSMQGHWPVTDLVSNVSNSRLMEDSSSEALWIAGTRLYLLSRNVEKSENERKILKGIYLFFRLQSGGQVDNGTPVLHKFSQSTADAASMPSDPTPEWTYTCSGGNLVSPYLFIFPDGKIIFCREWLILFDSFGF